MTTQRKQIGNEQFFTQRETAQKLSEWMQQQSWFKTVTEIVEPSAGDGVWLDHLNVNQAFDIDPKDPRVQQADFLATSLAQTKCRLFVGNPPFGRMGKLALQFIKKAALEGNYIAFILPASFGKETVLNRVPRFMHLIYQLELLDETFRFEKDGKKIPVVFQVWEKRDYPREILKKKLKTDDFIHIKTGSVATGSAPPAPQNADFAICTHGSGYGKILTANLTTLNSRTHRFFTAVAPVNEIVGTLQGVDWKEFAKYTVGPPCISVKEIMSAYQTAKDKNATTKNNQE